MTIKLLLLKSGEDIIADVTEMVSATSTSSEENPIVIGYFLDKPCVVKMRNNTHPGEKYDIKEEKPTSYQVSLFPWMPLSKEEKIPLVTDWVITMTTPVDKLEEMYIEEVVDRAKNNQNISTIE
jgi:hypothetical protein